MVWELGELVEELGPREEYFVAIVVVVVDVVGVVWECMVVVVVENVDYP